MWICWQALGRSLDVFWSPFTPRSKVIPAPLHSPSQQDSQFSPMQAEMLPNTPAVPTGSGAAGRGSLQPKALPELRHSRGATGTQKPPGMGPTLGAAGPARYLPRVSTKAQQEPSKWEPSKARPEPQSAPPRASLGACGEPLLRGMSGRHSPGAVGSTGSTAPRHMAPPPWRGAAPQGVELLLAALTLGLDFLCCVCTAPAG